MKKLTVPAEVLSEMDALQIKGGSTVGGVSPTGFNFICPNSKCTINPQCPISPKPSDDLCEITHKQGCEIDKECVTDPKCGADTECVS